MPQVQSGIPHLAMPISIVVPAEMCGAVLRGLRLARSAATRSNWSRSMITGQGTAIQSSGSGTSPSSSAVLS
ncbi:hypothetical protein ASE91_00735 [Sphingomonas sp. Leaf62]|nr:hypothetical protein ASE91_00735 [Sphingomonas sp. Leaf62]